MVTNAETGRGSANPLVPRVAGVCAANDIGQTSIDNQTALAGRHGAGFLVCGVEGQAQRNGTWRQNFSATTWV